MNTITKNLFRLTIAVAALSLVGTASADKKKSKDKDKYASAPAVTDKVAKAIYDDMLKALATDGADCQGVGQKDTGKKYETKKTKDGKVVNPKIRTALTIAVNKNKQNHKNIFAWEKKNKKKMMEYKRTFARKYCNAKMHEKLKKAKEAAKKKSKK